MESIKVRFNDLYPYSDGCQIVFDLMRDLSREELQALYDNKSRALELSWKVFRNRRSLNANAYHWKLCGLLAEKMDSTPQAVHKDLILKGSALKITNGVAEYVIYPDTYDPNDMEYIRACREIFFNNKFGKRMRHLVYLRYKDSHEMNTAEFSRLIEDTVAECHAQGIETRTKEEIEEMVKAREEEAAGL